MTERHSLYWRLNRCFTLTNTHLTTNSVREDAQHNTVSVDNMAAVLLNGY